MSSPTRQPTVIRLRKKSFSNRSFTAQNIIRSPKVCVERKTKSSIGSERQKTIHPYSQSAKPIENESAMDEIGQKSIGKNTVGRVQVQKITRSHDSFDISTDDDVELNIATSSPYSVSSSSFQQASTATLIHPDEIQFGSPSERSPSYFNKNSIVPLKIPVWGRRDEDDSDTERKRRRRRGGYCKITQCCCCVSTAIGIGAILLAGLIAAIVLMLLQPKTTTTRTTVTTVTTTSATTTTSTTSSSSTATTTTTTSTTSGTTSTTSTTTTTSTTITTSSTSTTTTSTTSSTTTTSTTTSITTTTTTTSTTTSTSTTSTTTTSTSTTSTSTTTTTTSSTTSTTTTITTTSTTSSTSTSSTTSTTSTSTTTTITTSTTSTSTSSTTSTTSTTTTRTTTTTTSTSTTSTTTTTTTTTGCTSCSNLCWNQTNIAVADTSSNSISEPNCINFDSKDTMVLCGHKIGYVVESPKNYTTQSQGTINTGDHIDSVIFDKNGFMYSNDHNADLVRRFLPDSQNGTIIAGAGSTVTGSLTKPRGLAIDDSLNLYIADTDGKKIYHLPPNGTRLIPVIDTDPPLSSPTVILSPLGTTNSIYITDTGKDAVYLWRFNTTSPSLILTDVLGGIDLKKPMGMKLDRHGNLYVADSENKRIVMFCANSTTGIVVATVNDKPIDLAFDSYQNLYVLTDKGTVQKYDLL